MAEGDSVPRLVLISGATGAGKTTLAKAVAHEMGMARIASSDTIREVMRATADSPDPALNRSSYGRGEVGDPATDWEDAAKAVQPGIEAVVERARRQGVDLVIEGVHVIPSRKLIGAWEAAGGAAVGIVVKIEDEDTHRERIEEREANTWRGVERYRIGFDRIRSIQRALEERGAGAEWKVVDTRLHQDGLGMVRQWLNEAWYAADRR
ncbi:MAG TPA: AAA family ATPase [Candidatus Thalassarchaeaceae archaeon]|jgi:2-phosphoglycerate kinase|nr:AAA family ATPase [Candidatus Thalassarchaeaceae archaeon]